jgi:hypothetical protein
LIIVEWLPEFHPALSRFFDLGAERNLPTWFSATQLASVGFLLGVFAIDRIRKHERPWGVVFAALAFLFLSLDETAQLHEKVGTISDALMPDGDRTNTVFRHTGIWALLLVPVLIGIFVMLWRGSRRYLTGFSGQTYLVLGVVIFLLSAGGLETLSNFASYEGIRLLSFLEELGEMAGISVVLAGVYKLCEFHSVTLNFGNGRTPG